MKKCLKMISVFMIIFLYIYGLNIPSINIDITIFLNVLMLCFSIFIFKNGFFIPRSILLLFIFLVIDFLISTAIPVLYNTYDFGILKTKVNLLISLFNVYSLSVYLNRHFGRKYIYKLLAIILLIQSIIICFSLINSDFSFYISNLSKSSNLIEKMIGKYNGARGLGLTIFSAFGLSIILGLQLLILCYSYTKQYISTRFFLIILVLATIASLSAGRTAFLGLILGLMTLSFTRKSLIYLSVLILGLILGLMSLLSIDISLIDNPNFYALYNYALEPLLNYKSGYGLATTSTVGLQKMYFSLDNVQFFFGDGLYSGPDGTYYMRTDAGYMRFVLFYGAFASLFLYGAFLFIMLETVKMVKCNLDKFFLFSILLLAFIFHYKGEVILFAIGFNKVLFLIIFSIIIHLSKTNLRIKI